MSVHPLPNAAPVKVPAAETLAGLRERIRTSPAFQTAYKDGQWRAVDFLMGIQCDEHPTRDDAGRDLLDMVLDEITRLPKPTDSLLTESSLLAVARFSGFIENLGGYQFDQFAALRKGGQS